jgi:hypothetical protein
MRSERAGLGAAESGIEPGDKYADIVKKKARARFAQMQE